MESFYQEEKDVRKVDDIDLEFDSKLFEVMKIPKKKEKKVQKNQRMFVTKDFVNPRHSKNKIESGEQRRVLESRSIDYLYQLISGTEKGGILDYSPTSIRNEEIHRLANDFSLGNFFSPNGMEVSFNKLNEAGKLELEGLFGTMDSLLEYFACHPKFKDFGGENFTLTLVKESAKFFLREKKPDEGSKSTEESTTSQKDVSKDVAKFLGCGIFLWMFDIAKKRGVVFVSHGSEDYFMQRQKSLTSVIFVRHLFTLTNVVTLFANAEQSVDFNEKATKVFLKRSSQDIEDDSDVIQVKNRDGSRHATMEILQGVEEVGVDEVSIKKLPQFKYPIFRLIDSSGNSIHVSSIKKIRFCESFSTELPFKNFSGVSTLFGSVGKSKPWSIRMFKRGGKELEDFIRSVKGHIDISWVRKFCRFAPLDSILRSTLEACRLIRKELEASIMLDRIEYTQNVRTDDVHSFAIKRKMEILESDNWKEMFEKKLDVSFFTVLEERRVRDLVTKFAKKRATCIAINEQKSTPTLLDENVELLSKKFFESEKEEIQKKYLNVLKKLVLLRNHFVPELLDTTIKENRSCHPNTNLQRVTIHDNELEVMYTKNQVLLRRGVQLYSEEFCEVGLKVIETEPKSSFDDGDYNKTQPFSSEIVFAFACNDGCILFIFQDGCILVLSDKSLAKEIWRFNLNVVGLEAIGYDETRKMLVVARKDKNVEKLGCSFIEFYTLDIYQQILEPVKDLYFSVKSLIKSNVKEMKIISDPSRTMITRGIITTDEGKVFFFDDKSGVSSPPISLLGFKEKKVTEFHCLVTVMKGIDEKNSDGIYYTLLFFIYFVASENTWFLQTRVLDTVNVLVSKNQICVRIPAFSKFPVGKEDVALGDFSQASQFFLIRRPTSSNDTRWKNEFVLSVSCLRKSLVMRFLIKVEMKYNKKVIATVKNERIELKLPRLNRLLNLYFFAMERFPMRNTIFNHRERHFRVILKEDESRKKINFRVLRKFLKKMQQVLNNRLRISDMKIQGASLKFTGKHYGIKNSIFHDIQSLSDIDEEIEKEFEMDNCLGNFIQKLVSLVPIQIAFFGQNHMFNVLVRDHYGNKKKLERGNHKIFEITEKINFGVHSNVLLQATYKEVFIVGCVGDESIGKSTLLDVFGGMIFHIGGGKCTRGIWMGITQSEKYMYVFLDFEGIGTKKTHGFEEENYLIFGSGVCNLMIYRLQKSLTYKITDMFDLMAVGGKKLKSANEDMKETHNGYLVVSPRDVMEGSDEEETIESLGKDIVDYISGKMFSSGMFEWGEKHLGLFEHVFVEHTAHFEDLYYEGVYRMRQILFNNIKSVNFNIAKMMGMEHEGYTLSPMESGEYALRVLQTHLAKTFSRDFSGQKLDLDRVMKHVLKGQLKNVLYGGALPMSENVRWTNFDKDKVINWKKTCFPIEHQENPISVTVHLGECTLNGKSQISITFNRSDFGLLMGVVNAGSNLSNDEKKRVDKLVFDDLYKSVRSILLKPSVVLHDVFVKLLSSLLAGIVDRRIEVCKKWRKGCEQEFRSFFDELRESLEVCGIKCGSNDCRLKCIKIKSLCEGHDCGTDHKCPEACNFCFDGSPMCFLPAAHDGEHCCDERKTGKKHYCPGLCPIKEKHEECQNCGVTCKRRVRNPECQKGHFCGKEELEHTCGKSCSRCEFQIKYFDERKYTVKTIKPPRPCALPVGHNGSHMCFKQCLGACVMPKLTKDIREDPGYDWEELLGKCLSECVIHRHDDSFSEEAQSKMSCLCVNPHRCTSKCEHVGWCVCRRGEDGNVKVESDRKMDDGNVESDQEEKDYEKKKIRKSFGGKEFELEIPFKQHRFKKPCNYYLPVGMRTHQGHVCNNSRHKCRNVCKRCGDCCTKFVDEYGSHTNNCSMTYHGVLSGHVTVVIEGQGEVQLYDINRDGMTVPIREGETTDFVGCDTWCLKLGRGHSHLIPCERTQDTSKCTDYYMKLQPREERRKHHKKIGGREYDKVTCRYFWDKYLNFTPIQLNTQRDRLEKCGAVCGLVGDPLVNHCSLNPDNRLCQGKNFHAPYVGSPLSGYYSDGHWFKCKHGPSNAKLRHHSIVIIDVSSSMEKADIKPVVPFTLDFNNRLGVALEALDSYCKRRAKLNPDDLVSVVLFNQFAEVALEFRVVTANIVFDTVEAGSISKPSCGTDFIAGIEKAINVHAKWMEERRNFWQYKCVVIFLSDGADKGHVPDLTEANKRFFNTVVTERVSRWNRDEGVTFHTLSLLLDDSAHLRNISIAGNGKYFGASDTLELTDHFETIAKVPTSGDIIKRNVE